MINKTKILVVEDDELVSELIYTFLTEYNFDITNVFTATDGVSYIKNKKFDLVLLDLNLPDFTGFELLKNIKINNISIPVIVMSAYSDIDTKLKTFKYGACDYMVKPIDLKELEARIWIHLSKNSNIDISQEVFEIIEYEIFLNHQKLELTTIEFEILKLLINNKNQTISREYILKNISTNAPSRSLDNHIKNIRKKLNINTNSNYLKTVYGAGYILEF